MKQLITVRKFLWQTSVWVNGFQQSGPLVEKVWSKAFSSFWPESRILKVLVLGLGCGSATKPLRQKFPNCYITGIEIDPKMIAIGKKHFNLSKIPNLKIILTDAKIFLKKNREKFDLILVDTYLGGTQIFLKNLEKFLTKDGVILVNKLKNLKNEILVVRGKSSVSI